MLNQPASKYRPFVTQPLPDRVWPTRSLAAAPRWLSTDMRDGNQSLIDPMNLEKKHRFFDLLVKCGFTEIEVGFPSASQIEFDFARELIDAKRIPDNVWVQVLTPSRPDLIERSFEALRGIDRAIVHLYNATSPLFRRVVFNLDKSEVIALAVKGAQSMLDASRRQPDTDWRFEYSPETFTMTETDFAVEVCNAVIAVIDPTPDKPLILNLPATVEVSMPNQYADQIEWFCRHIDRRDSVVISLHPHNDRGSGVAAAELGLLAGADRVEGCLFGNGERTGNVCLVTLALNLYTQGIAPGLDFSNLREVVRTVEYCNQLPVHPRHPYAGDLVFTAFSGSHQDAIKKGFAVHAERSDGIWEMPYLPIDPADLGCSYEAVIRVNSQSGKGGVAWIVEQDKGLRLPRRLQIDFSRAVQQVADDTGKEMSSADIWNVFVDAYGLGTQRRYELVGFTDQRASSHDGEHRFDAQILVDGREHRVVGHGNGLISSVVDALRSHCGIHFDVVDYDEHSLGKASDSQAAAYVECRSADGRTLFGVGIDSDIASASVIAVLNAANVLTRSSAAVAA